MACFHPIDAYEAINPNELGVRTVVFRSQETGSEPFRPVQLPCGGCLGCRIDRSREWAVRCMHEAESWPASCFITLTYNPECLPPYGSLQKREFQTFMKRLRKQCRGVGAYEVDGRITYPIRYFQCGEYGSTLDRPHHHACLFNFDFEDKELMCVKEGTSLFRSELLEELWSKPIDAMEAGNYPMDLVFERSGKYYVKKGFCTVGQVTFASAAYIARYCTKKVTGSSSQSAEHYTRYDEGLGEWICVEPEFATMSRRPGIGALWYEKYSDDLYRNGFGHDRGQRVYPPRYYDSIKRGDDMEAYERIKNERRQRAVKRSADNVPARLRVREKVLASKVNLLKRSIEE